MYRLYLILLLISFVHKIFMTPGQAMLLVLLVTHQILIVTVLHLFHSVIYIIHAYSTSLICEHISCTRTRIVSHNVTSICSNSVVLIQDQKNSICKQLTLKCNNCEVKSKSYRLVNSCLPQCIQKKCNASFIEVQFNNVLFSSQNVTNYKQVPHTFSDNNNFYCTLHCSNNCLSDNIPVGHLISIHDSVHVLSCFRSSDTISTNTVSNSAHCQQFYSNTSYSENFSKHKVSCSVQNPLPVAIVFDKLFSPTSFSSQQNPSISFPNQNDCSLLNISTSSSLVEDTVWSIKKGLHIVHLNINHIYARLDELNYY